jgi:hypothetical protein
MTRVDAAALADATERLLSRLLELADADAMEAYDRFADTAIDRYAGRVSAYALGAARERLVGLLADEEPTQPLAGSAK